MTRRHKLGATLAACALASGLTACGTTDSQDNTNAPSTTAPRKTADPQAADKKGVLRAYRGMTAAEERTNAKAKLDPAVEDLAKDKALAGIKAALFQQQQDGTIMKGKVRRSPKVTALDPRGSDPRRATVTDCADSSHYDEVHKDTGKKVAYSGSRRHVVTATAQHGDNGWTFTTYEISRNQTC